MNTPLRVLILEDKPDDAKSMVLQLKKHFDIKWRCVENEHDFRKALASEPPEVIVSDYWMPSFTAKDVLEILQAEGLDVPFIVVTGTGSEEVAVECLKNGADDYVIKKHLIRLPEAIQKAIEKHELIRQRKKTEEELQKSREAYKELYNEAPVGYHELDAKGNIVRVNRAETDLLGYRPEEMIGRPVFDFIAPEDRQKSEKAVRSKLVSKQKIKAFERKFKCKDGTVIYCLIEDRQIVDDRGRITGIRSTLQDITERKQAEEARERLETALEQAAEIVIITDPEGKIQYTNPAFEKITGYKREEAIGKNPSILKSGKQDEAFYRELWDTITQGQVWKGRFINKKKDGTFYHEEATISPVHDRSGKVINFVAVKRDVTQELEIENQLHHSQKMESIGQLAGGVAHDFNNILTSIMGFSSLLKRDKELSEKVKKRILEIEKASHRAAEIVKQLLTFSRKKPPELKTMNLNDSIKQSFGFLEKSLGPTFKIESMLDESLGMIQADGTQVQQVLMNLCVNARDAMPDGGTIIIETCNIEIKNDYVAQHTYAEPGPKVVLSITDTGTGMDKETISRIFEPFFTTKEVGEGTGLGMSIVYGIVKNHGGTIQIYSEVGYGTTVKIYFPRVSGDLDIEEKTEAEVRGGKETILIVDDDELVLNLASSVLEDYGYKYLTATGGPEALDIFRQKYKSIDLVLLDFIMPRMSGKEVFEEMLKVDPNVAVIMSSGFSVEDENVFLEKGVKAFVPKPYDEERLARSVREVLDERKTG